MSTAPQGADRTWQLDGTTTLQATQVAGGPAGAGEALPQPPQNLAPSGSGVSHVVHVVPRVGALATEEIPHALQYPKSLGLEALQEPHGTTTPASRACLVPAREGGEGEAANTSASEAGGSKRQSRSRRVALLASFNAATGGKCVGGPSGADIREMA